MGRPRVKPNLSQPHDRETVLLVFRRGGSLKEAADAIGTYPKAITRYGEKHAEFAKSIAAAIAEGDRDRAGVHGARDLSAAAQVGGRFLPPRGGSPHGPRAPSVAAAKVLGLDVGLVGAADDAMPHVPGLPEINVGNFMALMWKRAHGYGNDGEPCSPAVELAGIAVCDRVLAAPTIAAQRRLDDVARRIAQAETVGDVSNGIGAGMDAPTGEGMVFLELPSNGSEAPGHGPRPIDAEVVQ